MNPIVNIFNAKVQDSQYVQFNIFFGTLVVVILVVMVVVVVSMIVVLVVLICGMSSNTENKPFFCYDFSGPFIFL